MSKQVACCQCADDCTFHPASLIAAAPMMLESLKEAYVPFCNLIDQINQFYPEGIAAEEYQRFMGVLQRIHGAISKAEGRS